MGSHNLVFPFVIFFYLQCLTATADISGGSVFFLDGPDHRYLRTQSTSKTIQSHSMSFLEVSAAVSVLLGSAPPASLSAVSSSKLDEILVPSPFDRPCAVFMLEVTGVKAIETNNDMLMSAFKSEVVLGPDAAEVKLSGEAIFVVSLGEGLEDYTDKDISDFASWLGGRYIIDSAVKLNGKLTIPLASGTNMTLHMEKKADREFIVSLLALLHNSKRAIKMHEDLSQSTQSPAELMLGCFDGIKALQEEYGGREIVQQGLELFLSTFSRMQASLEAAYKGHIVGVIFFNATPHRVSERMFNVMLPSWTAARMLSESNMIPNATNVTMAEVVLVRRTLAWITGIILLVSTFTGVYLLLNMPLTRDTLLYSNVKLD